MKVSGSRRRSPQFESSPSKTQKQKPLHEKKKEEFSCDECAFIGANQIQVNNHLSSKHGKMKVITEDVRDHSCKKCNYYAMSKIQLENHMKLIHQQFSEKDEKETAEEQYNCSTCDYQGTNKYQLEKHIQLKHSVNGSVETIKCRNCGEVFSYRRNGAAS